MSSLLGYNSLRGVMFMPKVIARQVELELTFD